MTNKWEINGNGDSLYFLGLQNHCAQHKMKRCLLLGRKAVTNLDSILKSIDMTLLTKVWFFQWSYMDVRVGP